jgi:DNA-binding transcriptional MerR regulator
MSIKNKALLSGKLARLTGVSADTVRHYEKLGILRQAQRTESGYRLYSSDTPDRVRLVQRALQFGFTLAELADILRVRDTGKAPCRRVLNLMQEKLRAIRHRIRELHRTEKEMRQLERQWRIRLARTAPSKQALLLHSLPAAPIRMAKPGENLKRRNKI